MIACLLHSSTASSCTCCIDPSFKLQGDLIRAYLSSGESGIHPNGIRDEKIMSYTVNKALFKNLRLLSLRYCCTVPVMHSAVLGFSDPQEIGFTDTDTHRNQLLYAFSTYAPRHNNRSHFIGNSNSPNSVNSEQHTSIRM